MTARPQRHRLGDTGWGGTLRVEKVLLIGVVYEHKSGEDRPCRKRHFNTGGRMKEWQDGDGAAGVVEERGRAEVCGRKGG